MSDLFFEKLLTAIEKGKVRGFDEIKEINGENYLFEYAIKKENGNYPTYLFHIPLLITLNYKVLILENLLLLKGHYLFRW